MYTNHKPVPGVFNKGNTSNIQSWMEFSNLNSKNSAQSDSVIEKEGRNQFSINFNSKNSDRELS